MGQFLFDRLESRVFMSAAAMPGIRAALHRNSQPSAAQIIAADQAEVIQATNQSNTDADAAKTTAGADSAAVTAAQNAAEDGSVQEFQLQADQAASLLTVQVDQNAIDAVANSLGPVIADYKQIATDQSSPAALAIDQGQLATDQAALQSSVRAAVAKLQADQTASDNTIAGDVAALNAMVQSTPTYEDAVAKQEADAAAAEVTSEVDQAILPTAKEQLLNDEGFYGAVYGGSVVMEGGVLYQSDDTTVAITAEISSTQAQLAADQQTQAANSSADPAAVAAAQEAVISGSKQQAHLLKDQKAAAMSLRADQEAASWEAKLHLAPIIGDYEQIAIHQGNAAELAADQNRLAADQASLVRMVTKAVDISQVDQAASAAAIAADQSAINQLVQSNTAYVAAVGKLQSDTATDANAVQSDQAILAAAQAQLYAEESRIAANPPQDTLISSSGVLTINSGTIASNSAAGSTQVVTGTLQFFPSNSSNTSTSGLSLQTNSGTLVLSGVDTNLGTGVNTGAMLIINGPLTAGPSLGDLTLASASTLESLVGSNEAT